MTGSTRSTYLLWRKLPRCCVWVLLLILVAACQPDTAVQEQDSELKDTRWVMVELYGEPPLPDTEVTLNDEGDRFRGSTGCNQYQWRARLEGGQVLWPPETGRKEVLFEITVQLCTEPPGIMDQEQAFTAALMDAKLYQVSSSRLELLNEFGEINLVFEQR